MRPRVRAKSDAAALDDLSFRHRQIARRHSARQEGPDAEHRHGVAGFIHGLGVCFGQFQNGYVIGRLRHFITPVVTWFVG